MKNNYIKIYLFTLLIFALTVKETYGNDTNSAINQNISTITIKNMSIKTANLFFVVYNTISDSSGKKIYISSGKVKTFKLHIPFDPRLDFAVKLRNGKTILWKDINNVKANSSIHININADIMQSTLIINGKKYKVKKLAII